MTDQQPVSEDGDRADADAGAGIGGATSIAVARQQNGAEAAGGAAFEERAIEILTRDDTILSGTLFMPDKPRFAVLVSAATGVPARFYARFAREGAARGVAVLTYDYRGIGGSAPQSLRGYQADKLDWGRSDFPAALDALARAAPGVKLRALGHSVGGHLLGFAHNHALIDRFAFVSVGSGYWAKHRFPMNMQGLFLWFVYGPACMSLFGYLPEGGLWGGAALPKPVFTLWRRWCLSPRYFFDELPERLQPNSFHEVATRIRSFIYADDPIANMQTAQDMLDCYPNADTDIFLRAPSDYGLKSIGHNGPFRPVHKPAADEIWNWLSAD